MAWNLLENLDATFQNADMYYMSKFEKGDEESETLVFLTGSVRMLFPSLFQSYKGINYHYFTWGCCSNDCPTVKG